MLDDFEHDDPVEDIIESSEQKQETPLSVLKELFKLKDIESKTELSPQQVVLINQKRTISRTLDWTELDKALNDFMLLQISNSRKGRAEFVDAFKSDRERESDMKSGGFFSGLKQKLGFN